MRLIRALPIVALLAFLPASVAFGQTADPGLSLGQPAVKEQVRTAIQEMLSRPAFHTMAGAPDAALGFDGDAYMDVATGAFYRKQDGAWSRIGDIWLDPTVPALPPAPPPVE